MTGGLFKNLKIKWQLSLMIILLLGIPMIALIGFAYFQVRNVISSQIENVLRQNAVIANEVVNTINMAGDNKVRSDLNVARNIFYSYGTPSIVDGKMVLTAKAKTVFQKDENGKMIGTTEVGGAKYIANGNYEIVDTITGLVGGTATIFQLKDYQGENKDDATSIGWSAKQGFYRISTNVTNADGSRALGTMLSRKVFDKTFAGETYVGYAEILGKMYHAAYEPIKDGAGNVIGVLYVGVKEQDYIDTMRANLSKIAIGKEGYVFIIDDKGNYVLSKNNEQNGLSIWESKDVKGNFVFQNIIKQGLKLGERQTGVMRYTSQNNNETKVTDKIVSFSHIPDRSWILGINAIKDEVYAKELKNVLSMLVPIGVAFLMLGGALIYMYANSLTKSLQKLEKLFVQVDNGNLNIEVDEALYKNGTEIGQMSRAFYKMIDTLKSVISTIKNNITTTAASAEQLSTSAQQVNASMQQFMVTVDSVAKGALSVSRGATEVQQASDLTSTSAENGGKAAQVVKEKMSAINSTTIENASKIKALGERSNKISDIVETINSISEQTNLLALNAAIEAARAGEAGRGFAVVADEVRKLAEESSQATEQISDLIEDIKREINSAVGSMDKNTTQVNEGASSIQDALKSFEAIPVLVDNVNQSLMKMVSAAEENATGTNLLSSSIQQVTSAMQQVSSAAQQLNAGAEELAQMASNFKIN